MTMEDAKRALETKITQLKIVKDRTDGLSTQIIVRESSDNKVRCTNW